MQPEDFGSLYPYSNRCLGSLKLFAITECLLQTTFVLCECFYNTVKGVKFGQRTKS